MLDAVVRNAASLFRADAVVVFLADARSLTPAAWVGLQPQLIEGIEVPSAGRLQEYMDRFMAPRRCVDYLEAPLAIGDRSLGAIAVCSSRDGQSLFRADDHEMLRLLAQRAAEAVDRAQTADRAERQKGAIARIASTLVREAEPRKVAETAVGLAVAELDADAAVVWTSRPGERVLELLAISGANPETVRALERLDFDARTLASITATTREVQMVEGLDEGAGMELLSKLFAMGGMQSGIDAPLLARGQLMGVLSFARRSPGRWTSGERTIVTTMADLLASALLNARLHDEQMEAREKLEELTSRLKATNEALVEANLRSGELAELAQQRAVEMEATIANIADAVFVCDPRGKILMINSAGLEMIGISGEGEEFRFLRDYLAAARVRFLDGHPIPAEALAISRALQDEVVRGVEEIIYDSRAGRDRYILVSAAPIRDQAGKLIGAVEVQSDITRLKELDLLKDQFFTVASHEIKTAVTAIKGFAQSLLRRDTDLDKKHRNALETIVRQSDRIDALVRDFLEVSRMRRGYAELSRQRLDLAELVSHVVDRTMPSTDKHRVFMSDREQAWVNAGADRVEEVVMNLLENAMRYSPSGGDVEVRVLRDGQRAIVSVRDEGVGIPEGRKRNLFERFYRAHIGTSLDYGGLGVGLYISREIVRQHGGDMWFESQEGRGSTFYFSLPLAEDAHNREAA